MKKIILLLLVSLIFSCQNSTSTHQPEPKLGEKFGIKFGQKIIIPEEYIIIEFKDVLGDSRCPKGLMCFWAGNAKIAIELNEKKVNLNTYLEPKQISISNYKIDLIELNPYPEHKVEIQKKEYVAKLLITKR